MKKIKFLIIGLFVTGLIAVNVVTVNSDASSKMGINLNSMFTNAFADTEDPPVYKWSNDIDCPGFGNGNYQVCQENGMQNICSSPGSTTCNCGSPVNWNKDGNCD